MDQPASPDLAIGSWSDRGPWVVEPDAMPWRADVARRRAQARDQVASWLQPGTFPPAGRVARVVGRVGIAVAAWYLIDRRRGVEAGRRRSPAASATRLPAGPTHQARADHPGGGAVPAWLVQESAAARRAPPELFDDAPVVELDLGRSLDDVRAVR
jgi:hypothetical protein